MTDLDDLVISYTLAGGGDGLINYINVRNDTGGNITKGQLVYISGSVNENRAKVKLAKADSSTTMPCVGILSQNLSSNENGVAITYGKAKGLNTSGFTNEGDTVYVSPTTAGDINISKPINGTLIQNIGIVMKKNTNSGVIFITGIGRANDIPNSSTITSFDNTSNHVYVSTGTDESQRFNKLLISNLGAIAKSYSTLPSGTTGEIVYDTSVNKLKVKTNTGWETITST